MPNVIQLINNSRNSHDGPAHSLLFFPVGKMPRRNFPYWFNRHHLELIPSNPSIQSNEYAHPDPNAVQTPVWKTNDSAPPVIPAR
jgi:hypothetical protein